VNNKLKIGIAALIILVGLFFINQNNQKSYTSQSTSLFSISENDIKKILIQANQEAVELIKVDTTWSISGNDTLVVKDRSISQFFDKVLNLKLETLMTTKQEKWETYNISDSLGTHLALVGWNDETVGYYVFGRSNSDYARCYVRTDQSSDVYLTNENIVYSLQTSPTYWGEKPVENIPE
jgi:hypothetical protein